MPEESKNGSNQELLSKARAFIGKRSATLQSLNEEGNSLLVELGKHSGEEVAELQKSVVDAGHSVFIDSMRMMHGIANEMRESNPDIKELDRSEAVGDRYGLKQVIFPESGGVLTYMGDFKHPYEGFPFIDFVQNIDLLKKLSRAFLSGLYHTAKHRGKLSLILAAPLVWFLPDMFYVGVYTAHRFVERFRLKPIRYCRVSREVYRAFGIERTDENERTKDLRLKLRDLVCMLLEFDNAYRYRFQDMIQELDQVVLKRNTVKELLRLIDIGASREKTQEIRDTWTLAKMAVRWYLRFDRKLQGIIRDVLINTNLGEVALNEADQQFAVIRKDYQFAFK